MKDAIEGLGRMAKGGPYIGPKGGKWADAAHKVAWKDKKATASTAQSYDQKRKAAVKRMGPLSEKFGSWRKLSEAITSGEVSATAVEKQYVGGEANDEQWDRDYDSDREYFENKRREKSMDAISGLESLSKGGPYIGPRGGKWADAKHTVAWKDDAAPKKKGANRKESGVLMSKHSRAISETMRALHDPNNKTKDKTPSGYVEVLRDAMNDAPNMTGADRKRLASSITRHLKAARTHNRNMSQRQYGKQPKDEARRVSGTDVANATRLRDNLEVTARKLREHGQDPSKKEKQQKKSATKYAQDKYKHIMTKLTGTSRDRLWAGYGRDMRELLDNYKERFGEDLPGSEEWTATEKARETAQGGPDLLAKEFNAVVDTPEGQKIKTTIQTDLKRRLDAGADREKTVAIAETAFRNRIHKLHYSTKQEKESGQQRLALSEGVMGSLSKGGPYIGPRGGKWADAKHTISWDDRGKKPRKKRAKSKAKGKLKATKQTIQLFSKDGAGGVESTETVAHVYGSWAAHKSPTVFAPDKYSVTHVGTGRSAGFARTLAEARALAQKYQEKVPKALSGLGFADLPSREEHGKDLDKITAARGEWEQERNARSREKEDAREAKRAEKKKAERFADAQTQYHIGSGLAKDAVALDEKGDHKGAASAFARAADRMNNAAEAARDAGDPHAARAADNRYEKYHGLSKDATKKAADKSAAENRAKEDADKKAREAGRQIKPGKVEGHRMTADGKHIADTGFMTRADHALPGFSMEHMGFGEFYLKGPGGRIDFARGGPEFEGQSGRSHYMYDDAGGELVEKLLDAVAKKEGGGKSEKKVPSPLEAELRETMDWHEKNAKKSADAIGGLEELSKARYYDMDYGSGKMTAKYAGARWPEKESAFMGKNKGDVIQELIAKMKGGDITQELIGKMKAVGIKDDVIQQLIGRCNTGKARKSHFEPSLKKGLYAFELSGSESKGRKLADNLLPQYLAAFVEQAYEHEKQECEHMKNKPAGHEDQLNFFAMRIMNELVIYMRNNPDLMAAGKDVTGASIASILRNSGLVQPDVSGFNNEAGNGWSGEAELARSGESPWLQDDPAVRPAPKMTDHHKQASFVDDTEDPAIALRKSQDAQRQRAFTAEESEFVIKGDGDCPLHGYGDLTKMQNLLLPMGKCTCN